MAGKKRKLQKLYEEFEILKDRHEKQITKLQSVIEEQGTKIKMLERQKLTNLLTYQRSQEKLLRVLI